MKLEEKKVSSNTVYSGKILRLDVDEVELPDGKPAVRECVRHTGGAAALFIREGKVALVRQYRYLYGEELYEIPAGKLERGEDARLSAMRELEEETGYRAASAKHLLDIYPTPGYTDEVIHIYLIDDAVHTAQHLDEGEFLNVKFLPLCEVLSLIEIGAIKDAKTVCAVLKYVSASKNKCFV